MTRPITWVCRRRVGDEVCGYIVVSERRPDPIRWTDGHVCHFEEEWPASPPKPRERWEEITPETMVEIDREGGHVACEGCGRELRRIVRVTEKGRN
jgi:hypothetical protein